MQKIKTSYYELECIFRDFLTKRWGLCLIFGHKYPTGDALKAVDPVLYNEVYRDWLNNLFINKMLEADSEGNLYRVKQ